MKALFKNSNTIYIGECMNKVSIHINNGSAMYLTIDEAESVIEMINQAKKEVEPLKDKYGSVIKIGDYVCSEVISDGSTSIEKCTVIGFDKSINSVNLETFSGSCVFEINSKYVIKIQ